MIFFANESPLVAVPWKHAERGHPIRHLFDARTFAIAEWNRCDSNPLQACRLSQLKRARMNDSLFGKTVLTRNRTRPYGSTWRLGWKCIEGVAIDGVVGRA